LRRAADGELRRRQSRYLRLEDHHRRAAVPRQIVLNTGLPEAQTRVDSPICVWAGQAYNVSERWVGNQKPERAPIPGGAPTPPGLKISNKEITQWAQAAAGKPPLS